MLAKPIMIQGTMSSAGKSLIAAGLCRIFRQDGLRVAPFKSQNMALNSYITREGLEMGRAQVVQAQAAGVEPSVRMNPILLKPQSDTGSQVILNGEVWATLSAAEYYKRKPELLPHILRAYESLAAENDVVVIEGAGSPAEINLREHDLVNMGMARMAKAPVLLVGDIDRGGVFASLYGTAALMEPWEKRHLKGFVINKFRGDVELLRPGLRQIEQLAGLPVLGVVPWLTVDLDDEDSLSTRLDRRTGTTGGVDVAVIRLPRISNFTDFAPLESLPGAAVRYVSAPRELGEPDLIILPGTKSTIPDLLWLRQNGLEAAIQKLAVRGTLLLGVCGGYQMLGRTLSDPQGVETSPGTTVRGMGLLPGDTVFQGRKVRTRAAGRVLSVPKGLSPLEGACLEGYEIHMGETRLDPVVRPFCKLSTLEGIPPREEGTLPKEEGAVYGSVFGTYLHGLFDTGEMLEGLWKALAARKGLTAEAAPFDPAAYREEQYDRLAAALRESLDMEAVYRIMEEGV